jgi:LmbE family N-acetylglucosaminyl deacetylase
MNVLCVAAHPDDEVIGVGGTLARHAGSGDSVSVCILSDGVTSRYDDETEEMEAEISRRRERARAVCEALGVEDVTFYGFPDNRLDSVPLLDIVQTIEDEIRRIQPATVYTHPHGDLNVDHELVARATITATRPLTDSPVERVLAYETVSATEWAIPEPSNAFQPTSFVDIGDTLERKLDALRAYESELRDHPHPRNVDNVRRNAMLWGAKSGMSAAEPFELLRELR